MSRKFTGTVADAHGRMSSSTASQKIPHGVLHRDPEAGFHRAAGVAVAGEQLAGADEKLNDEIVSRLLSLLLISEAGIPQRCQDVGHEVEVLHRSHAGPSAAVRDAGQ